MPKCIYIRIGKESKCRRADHQQKGAEPGEADRTRFWLLRKKKQAIDGHNS